ncbi:MAG: hypothetical protein ACI9C3_000625, partial [Yoonia sp.]
ATMMSTLTYQYTSCDRTVHADLTPLLGAS